MNKRIIAVLGCVVVAAGLWFGSAAVRANRNLVTLDVRDMEVRRVVGKMSWQTWEDIFVHREVQGKVTLNVRDMPLDQALRMVADQVGSRSSTLYPLYTQRSSFATLKKSLRGEVDPATHGWTNLVSRGPLGFGVRQIRIMSQPQQTEAKRVSLNLMERDLSFTALAFNRFAQARLVPEDSATAKANVTIRNSSVPSAVAQVAKSAGLKWAVVYALESRPAGPNLIVRGEGAEVVTTGSGAASGSRIIVVDAPRDGDRRPMLSEEHRAAMQKEREALNAELKQALPPSELAKIEQAEAEREEMRQLPPEQRRERMMPSAAEMNQMNRERILNTTPEQRAQGRGYGGPGG
ncbi:MAG TPA: hypothetical protein VK530_14265 [Candidatus Acidoferrum sp.]|nr:hypothetical protein [Candidatus Acidoferrum sp.]